MPNTTSEHTFVNTPDPRAANALKDGLFARRDFVRPVEIAEYDEFRGALLEELSPQTVLEQSYADEIVTAHWRLRRCRMIESALAAACGDDFLLSPEDEQRQKSVDRARAQSQNALRKATAELRALQTERSTRAVSEVPGAVGLGEIKKVIAAGAAWSKRKAEIQRQQNRAFNDMLERTLGPLPPAEDDEENEGEDLFCKTAGEHGRTGRPEDKIAA